MTNTTLLTSILPFRTSSFARAVVNFGSYRLHIEGSYPVVPNEYVAPVKKYCAETCTLAVLQNALKQHWISEQEYSDIINYIE